VLLDGAWADVQLGSDVFVPAPQDQQFQDLLIAAGDFDLIEVDHACLFAHRVKFAARSTREYKARVSPKFRWVAQWDKYLWMLALQDEAENRP
jgi:hypothetical protein